MSTTGPDIVKRCRAIMREEMLGRPVFGDDEMREAVNRHAPIVCKKLGLGTAWSTSIVTLVPGTVEYTLPGTAEYERIVMVRFESDKKDLPLRGLDEILKAHEGGPATGRPQRCAMRPTSSQSVSLLVDRDPATGEDLDALVSLQPDVWDASDATAPTYALSQAAARALELSVCASVVETAGAEKLNQLAIGDNAVARWGAEAAELLRLEELTIIRMKRSHGPMNYGWFVAWSRT